MVGNIKNSFTSKRVHAILHVLFGVYVFLYFYFIQSPFLELTQYHLSEGKTIFNPLISALTLTFLALVIQRFVVKCFKFQSQFAFAEYLPSSIFVVLLTAFTPSTNYFLLGASFVALLVFALLYFISSHIQTSKLYSFFYLGAVNGVGLACVMAFIGAFSNSNDVQFYELKMARLINERHYDEALHCGESSLATSRRMSALRAYAMNFTDKGLGEVFFSYPVPKSGAELLMFSPNDTLAQLLPPDSLYGKLGVWPSESESALAYFERVKERSSHQWVKDYWLTALLLEKKLPLFCKELGKCYPAIDSIALPKHYQEALVLSAIQNRDTVHFVGDSLLFSSFSKYQEMGTGLSVLAEKNLKRREYGNTYWWYYYYQN